MNNEFQSIFAPYLKNYLAERKALGYKYDNHRHVLSQFDAFCWEENWSELAISEDLAKAFIYGDPELAHGTIHQKEVVLSYFAEYLYSFNIPVYRYEIRTKKPKSKGFVPHIFTDEELRRLFAVIDNQHPEKNSNKHLVDPVLFRLLLGSGLRISEALGLKVADFHYDECYIVLKHTKNDKERLVPVAQSVADRMKKLIETTDTSGPLSDRMVFTPLGRSHFRVKSIERHFRDYLALAGIQHTENGPRVHDLRHTFCVKCFHRWDKQGLDLENLLPYLSAFLGHNDFKGTQVYLRLTAEMYPEITEKMDRILSRYDRGAFADEEE